MFENVPEHQLILASASPRRRELLASVGIKFEILSPDCDETVLRNENAEAMVRRLSLLKAETIAAVKKEAWVLAADTTVYVEGSILGKPCDEKEAFEMLKSISGRWHEVWGGISLVNKLKSVELIQSHKTDVRMRNLSDSEIRKFIETGEPMDKAGAYAIQGMGASLVSEVKGSYTNVVGLNMSAVVEELLKLGIIK